MTERVDKAGVVASTLCAIHCALCALLPKFLGALGVGFLLGQGAELVFTLVAIGFAMLALVVGWKSHGTKGILILMCAGILGLTASRVIEMASGHDHHDARSETNEKEGSHADSKTHEASEKSHTKTENEAESYDNAHAEHHDEDDSLHGLGAAFGVIGGILLVLGHVFNIRATRRRGQSNLA